MYILSEADASVRLLQPTTWPTTTTTSSTASVEADRAGLKAQVAAHPAEGHHVAVFHGAKVEQEGEQQSQWNAQHQGEDSAFIATYARVD